MTRPLNTEITALSAVTLHYSPGIVVYDLKIVNNNSAKQLAVSVSYDRASGTLVATVGEAGA
jgi:hypothetical protein